MHSQRHRAITWAIVALVTLWLAAWGGYQVVKHSKMTSAKIKAYIESLDLSKLSAEARAKAIRDLAAMINRLSWEERQRLRLGRMAEEWFKDMTEAEKAEFIELTMPTGLKQMLTAFEQMPEDKRRRAVDEAVKHLREAREKLESGEMPKGEGSSNGPPPMSPEMEAKMREVGLKAFYTESSAEAKAELAPVLEELQRVMEFGGGRFRGP